MGRSRAPPSSRSRRPCPALISGYLGPRRANRQAGRGAEGNLNSCLRPHHRNSQVRLLDSWTPRVVKRTWDWSSSSELLGVFVRPATSVYLEAVFREPQSEDPLIPQGRRHYSGPRISLRNQGSPHPYARDAKPLRATCPGGQQRRSTLGTNLGGNARRPLEPSNPRASLAIQIGSGPPSARAPRRRRLPVGLCAEGLRRSSNLPR